jgi:mannose-1-phosphate guanylyltransferase
MNGKLVFAPDLDAAHALHVARGALATMVVKEVGADDPTGVVLVDDQHRVRGLPGHTVAAASGLRRCMYTGVSLLSAAAHPQLPDLGCLIRQGYAPWVASGACVVAHVEPSSFRDVGMSLWHYQEANLALATGAVCWPGIDPGPGGVIVADSAVLAADVSLQHSVVGAGARLAPGTQLTRCVVWPGAQVAGLHRDAVLLPDGRAVQVPQR